MATGSLIYKINKYIKLTLLTVDSDFEKITPFWVIWHARNKYTSKILNLVKNGDDENTCVKRSKINGRCDRYDLRAKFSKQDGFFFLVIVPTSLSTHVPGPYTLYTQYIYIYYYFPIVVPSPPHCPVTAATTRLLAASVATDAFSFSFYLSLSLSLSYFLAHNN